MGSFNSAVWTTPPRGAQGRLLRYDRILFLVLLGHLPVIMFLAPMGYGTQRFAIDASSLVGVFAVASYVLLRGTPAFGFMSGILLMAFSGILIQVQLGRIEMHFHIFVALAILLIYKDWRYILVAAVVIICHQVAFTALQLNAVGIGAMPIMLYNYGCSWSIASLHIGFVVFEALALIYCAVLMRRDEQVTRLLMDAITTIDQNNDLSVRIQELPNNSVVGAFNAMIAKFATLTASASIATRKIDSISRQLDDSAQCAEADLASQHNQSAWAANAMTEMTETVEQVVETSQSVAMLATITNDKAVNSHERFNYVMRSTADLQQIMVDASDSIRVLERNALGIDASIDAIRKLSEQTDRLALEATAEAADDGEHGRGCAGVADAAQILAQHTQDSTAELQTIIQTIQQDIENSAVKIDHGRRRTDETSSEILRTGLVLNEILESVSHISAMNTQIARAIAQQSGVGERITRKIAAISTHRDNLAEQFQQNLIAASTLKSLSDALNQLVSGYRY